MAGLMRVRWSLLALGLLACDGGRSVCDRLGDLCTGRDVELRMDLARSVDATADLDGDGILDVVTAAPRGGLSIVWGKERQREYFLFAGGVPDAAISDVDGDGDLDVVFVTADPPELRLLDNRGGRELVDEQLGELSGRPQSVWVGALAGGDAVDIVVASALAGGLTIFGEDMTSQHIAVGEDLVAVEAGDLDGDGHLEIVAADLAGSALFVVRAEGTGFAAPQRVASGPAPEYLELYDFDGDGPLDALTHGRAGPEVWVHDGDGKGGLAGPRAITVQEHASEGFVAHRDPSGGRWLITAEYGQTIASALDDEDRVVRRVHDSSQTTLGVRRDGDAVVTHGAAILRRSLAPAHMFSESSRIPSKSSAPLVLGDFDSDGAVDVAVTAEDGVVLILPRLSQAPLSTGSGVTVSQEVLSMISADVTGDGLLDLVIGEAETVQVAVGHGDGRFDLAPPTILPLVAWKLHAFDPQGTGAAAVAVVPHNALADPNMLVLEFDATGAVAGFSRPIEAGYVAAMTSADVDGDAREDLVLVVLEDSDGSLVIVSGDESEPVKWRHLSSIISYLSDPAITVGDLAGDGAVDAVLVGWETVVLLPDIGVDTPPPATVAEINGFDGGGSLGIVDVDGDGRLDVVHCSDTSASVLLADSAGGLTPQEPLEQWMPNYALHVDDDAAIAVAETGSGIAVLTPAVVPSLARTNAFGGGSGYLNQISTGDVDADGQIDIAVSSGDQHGYGLGVLWGAEDGRPRRAVWMDYTIPALLIVKQVDDRPGDEIVAVGPYEGVKVWTYMDGGLKVAASVGFTPLNTLHDVAVAARRGSAQDVVVLGTTDEVTRVVALPRGDAGEFIGTEVVLWEGPGGVKDESIPKLATSDYDDDGYDDIAVLGDDEAVRVVWGDAERAGEVLAIHGGVENVRQIAAADINGDGVAELLLGAFQGVVRIDLRGREVREAVALGEMSGLDRLLVADVEGDGVVDIFGDNASWLAGMIRGPGGDERADIVFDPRYVVRPVAFAALGNDDILDIVGLRGGHVVTRVSDKGAP